MSSIQAIYWDLHTISLKVPFTIACKTYTSVDVYVLSLGLSNGKTGYGTATFVERVTGENHDIVQHAIQTIADKLKGKTFDLPTNCQQLQSIQAISPATSALYELALHDLQGKIHNRPLIDVFGRKHPDLPTSITLGIQNISQTSQQLEQYMAIGFTIFKIKIGANLQADIHDLHQIRQVIGPKALLRVDANQGYNLAKLQTFYNATAHLNIEFIEQPLAKNHEKELSSFKSCALAADESLATFTDAKRIAQADSAYHILNIKLMKCGGLTAAFKIADLATQHRKHLMWGCNLESIAGIAAAYSAALACKATKYLDLDSHLLIQEDLFSSNLSIQNGVLQFTSNAPGLGLEPKF